MNVNFLLILIAPLLGHQSIAQGENAKDVPLQQPQTATSVVNLKTPQFNLHGSATAIIVEETPTGLHLQVHIQKKGKWLPIRSRDISLAVYDSEGEEIPIKATVRKDGGDDWIEVNSVAVGLYVLSPKKDQKPAKAVISYQSDTFTAPFIEWAGRNGDAIKEPQQ